MEVKSLTLNGCKLNNNIFLAPLAGFTDYPFRSAVKDLGYGLRFTELISAKGLFYEGDNSVKMLKKDDCPLTAVQIFGSDPYYMRLACESDALKDFKIVDINMGCPVPKVFKNGDGSALLKNIDLAEKIIHECVKSGKIITVKIRKSLHEGEDVARDFAVMAENAGASLITIHARSKDAYYSGEPDYDSVYKAKKAVNIPVIFNGGLFDKDSCDKAIENTGADGVMLARGGISNPFLICDLLKNPQPFTLKGLILTHIKNMADFYPKRRAALEFRKFVPYYFKGKNGLKDLKMQIYSAETPEEIYNLISENL